MTFGRRRSRRPDDWPSGHVRARAALSDRMDGALDPSEAGWLNDHLGHCPACRAIDADFAGQRLELRALRDRAPVPPRDLWARTAAAIESEAGGRSRAAASNRRNRLLAPSALIATALVVAVAIGTLTSSQRPLGGGPTGSTDTVAVASSAPSSGRGQASPGRTPIVVNTDVAYVAPDAEGNFHVTVRKIEKVCPEGSTEPCDTAAPVEESSVTVDQHAQAVFGSTDKKRLIVMSSPTTDDPGTVSVVALTDEPSPSASPPASQTPPPSTPVSPPPTTPVSTRSVPPSNSPRPPSATPPASATPTPTLTPTITPTPLVTATPTGSIDVTPPDAGTIEIAHGVVLVGQTAEYSSSGEWFAFTARPIDGSSGPDIYLWRVGSAAAEKVTDDGRSVFGSWVGEEIVGSSVRDATTEAVAPATTGLHAEAFVLDASTRVRTALGETGNAWRPAVGPAGRRAVYWAGTLRTVPGPGFAPEGGRLVLGDWAADRVAPSGSPAASPSVPAPSASGSGGTGDDQATARHEATIAAGRMADWDARWDESGTHLAVWIADQEDPAFGFLSLYAVSSFDGTIDVKTPLLDARRAAAGFSISDEGLVWAEPSADGASAATSIQLLAWTDEGIGSVTTLSGPAIVIR